MEVSGEIHAPVALPPRVTGPCTHWTGGWVGPRAGLEAVTKTKIPSLPSPVIELRSFGL